MGGVEREEQPSQTDYTMKIRFLPRLVATILLGSFAGAQAYDTNALTNGLVAWYPLHGNAKDYSDLGVNGVCYGGCNPTFDRFGNPSGALFFHGDETIGAPNYNYTRAFNKFTISIWVKPVGNNPDSEESIDSNGSTAGTLMTHPIILASQWGGAGSGIFISVGTNGVSILEHGAEFLPVLLNYKKEITDWTQISVVVDNNGPEQLYINGIYIRSSLSTGRAKLASAFAWNFDGANLTEGIGGSLYGKYVGSANDLRIYNRALSSNEVAALYAMESTPPAPPMDSRTNNLSSFSISQSMSNVISFPAPNGPLISEITQLNATSSSGLPVIYSTSSPRVTISNNIVTIASNYLCGLTAVDITASQTGNSNYLAATSVTRMVSVIRGMPSIRLIGSNPLYIPQGCTIINPDGKRPVSGSTNGWFFDPGANINDPNISWPMIAITTILPIAPYHYEYGPGTIFGVGQIDTTKLVSYTLTYTYTNSTLGISAHPVTRIVNVVSTNTFNMAFFRRW
jgi:Concanavalin A-like lectin/glucanases superfamily